MKEKIRIDKWLWSVRIFKTRTVAANEIRSGGVKINQKKAKPSSMLIRGDTVQVSKNGFNLVFKAIDLIERRVGASIAVQCYEDLTSEQEMNKYKVWFIGKAAPERREPGTGRPTKKERREIDTHKTLLEYDLE